MLLVLKGTNAMNGDECQEFTVNEVDTARGIAEIWKRRGWQPRLFVKSWDGRVHWLISQRPMRLAA